MIHRLIFLAVFSLLLITPGVATVIKIAGGGEEARSELERRRLVTVERALTEISEGRSDWLASLPRIGEALKDQLAWRPDVTRIVNRFLVGIGHSTGDQVVIGADNYWFQTGAPEFRRAACAAPQGLNMQRSRQMLEHYEAFAARAAEKGVKTYLLIIPLKPSVHSSKLPQPMRERCAGRPTPMQEILTEAGEVPGLAYDLDWFRSRGHGGVYDPRSFHWHRAGAQDYFHHVVTEGVMKGERRPASRGPEFAYTETVDTASDLGVAPLEYDVMARRLREKPESRTTGRDFRPELWTDILKGRREGTLLITQGGAQPGTGVLVGDSFSAKILSYFSRHFETSYRFHTSFMRLQPGVLDKIIDRTEPDYLVFVLTEAKWALVEHDDTLTGFERMFLRGDEGG